MTDAYSRARASTYFIGTTILSIAGVTYYSRRKPMMLDSAHNPSTKTLAFPKTMLVSQQLTVLRTQQINHDTKRITFSLPGGEGEVSGVPAGSAVLTQHTPKNGWFPVLRPYTPVSDPDERGILQLIVKQYPNGRASSHMHNLAPGQTLQIRGPIPGYSYTASSQPRDVVFIAGGAGITPIYSLAQGILKDQNDRTRIQLVWGVNGTRDIILKAELEQLEKQYPQRLRVTYCVSGPEGKQETINLRGEQKYIKGYVDQSVLQQAIKRCDSGTFGDQKGTKVFLCGPPSMENALVAREGILARLGIEKKNIHRF